MPALFGEGPVVESLLNLGIPLSKARNYGIVGCIEPTTIGAFGRNNREYFNLARIVDLAINNVVDRLTGKQLGPTNIESEKLVAFEDVMEAFREQRKCFARPLTIKYNIIDKIQAKMTPHILASILIPDCIEKGKDITAGSILSLDSSF